MTRVFGAGLLGVLAFVPGAGATTTNTHANIFHSKDGHDACFTFDDNGVYRNSTSGACSGVGLDLIAPIVYTPAGGSTVTVYAEGHCSTGYITCTLESFDYDGTLLGDNSLILTGQFDEASTIAMSYWGFAELDCTFPAASAGSSCKFLGLDIAQ